MRFRKLRIAWSVGWSLLAVLLIALWVRSYRHWDVFYAGLGQRVVGVNSAKGHLSTTISVLSKGTTANSGFHSMEAADEYDFDWIEIRGFHFIIDKVGATMIVPYWIFSALSRLPCNSALGPPL
jgi:hypothetical protein